jgi:hypothetical protein
MISFDHLYNLFYWSAAKNYELQDSLQRAALPPDIVCFFKWRAIITITKPPDWRPCKKAENVKEGDAPHSFVARAKN